jgi:hypothetical protein
MTTIYETSAGVSKSRIYQFMLNVEVNNIHNIGVRGRGK